MNRVVVLVEARPAVRSLALAGAELSPEAIVTGIREIERGGLKVMRVGDGRGGPVMLAADLILRLRQVSALLSEEELLVLLELLPL